VQIEDEISGLNSCSQKYVIVLFKNYNSYTDLPVFMSFDGGTGSHFACGYMNVMLLRVVDCLNEFVNHLHLYICIFNLTIYIPSIVV
jgi:hypothetical protein